MGCLSVIFERKGGVETTYERKGGIDAWYSQVCDVPSVGIRFCASDGPFLTKEGYSIIVNAQ